MGNSEVLRSVGERVRCAAAWKTRGGGPQKTRTGAPAPSRIPTCGTHPEGWKRAVSGRGAPTSGAVPTVSSRRGGSSVDRCGLGRRGARKLCPARRGRTSSARCQRNEPVTKRLVWCDFRLMRRPKSSDSQKQEVRQWSPGSGAGRGSRSLDVVSSCQVRTAQRPVAQPWACGRRSGGVEVAEFTLCVLGRREARCEV